ncbi:GH3 auxin-responsive promoter family protein [Fulvivirga maritima]|uniref:GH3 family domain-containing protein n=1 Tax=Fulvivirga maritima TaxID=2904247 RepID=UPI001F2A9638|nr:GH3 auxin-responsive promoter family protein [Fulvivirga maritima]UII26104.1 GH3 auxin-responsive promoter family protein [Fulvivirga maritima]
MAVLGNLIKTAIDLRDKFTNDYPDAEAQHQTLKKLLETAKDTAFGKHYNFEEVLTSDDIEKAYAERIPLHNYKKIHDEWWHKIQEGEENITWPGKPNYLALSSGTTGSHSKRIPVTDEMLESIRKAAIMQITSMAHFDMPAEFYEKEIMMLGSSTDLNINGEFAEGEISGISASNIPFWFKGYYKPGDQISKIEDWDERVQKIAENASNWDIGAISGIPSWIDLMLKKVIEYNHLDNIHEIWPNLAAYTSGGVAFEPYRKNFDQQMGKPMVYIDTYLASEGFIALQTRPQTDSMAMQLVTGNGIYFEFVPFKPQYLDENGEVKPDAPTVTLDDVEEETDYALVISTVAGTWRYLIGDTIKFTDKSRQEIVITGRTKHFLNVVGSQLSVDKMNAAISGIEEKYNMTIQEFTVAAVRENGDYIHKWYLGSDHNQSNETLAQSIDEELKSRNKNYGVARSKALTGVKVEVISPEIFHAWSEAKKKKGGQVKMPRVMKEDEFAEWESFVKEKQMSVSRV